MRKIVPALPESRLLTLGSRSKIPDLHDKLVDIIAFILKMFCSPIENAKTMHKITNIPSMDTRVYYTLLLPN